MKSSLISYQTTNKFSKLIIDYLNNDKKLHSFYNHFPTLENFSKQIKEKKSELKILYDSPRDIFTLERVGKWSIIQIAKLFLGLPIIPGR